MPCFEVLTSVDTAKDDKISKMSERKELTVKRLLQHFLTVNDLAKLLKSTKLTNWEALMESMLASGSFGGTDVSES